MIGAPEASWTQLLADQAAYYTGYGSGEVFWTLVAAAICVIAIVVGGIQEGRSFKKMD